MVLLSCIIKCMSYVQHIRFFLFFFSIGVTCEEIHFFVFNIVPLVFSDISFGRTNLRLGIKIKLCVRFGYVLTATFQCVFAHNPSFQRAVMSRQA